MNKIKSLFIGMFPIFAMGISGYGIYQLITSGMNFIWLGAILTTLPIMMFISRIMMFKDMARTTAHFPILTVIAISGFTLSIYSYMQLTQSAADVLSNQLAIIFASTGFVFYLLYNFWYSSLGRGSHGELQIGRQLPFFKATDTSGNIVDSNTFNDSPAIIIFFRGNWCPLCMAQIREIVDNYRELSKRGVKVVLISPQPEKNTQKLANKFDVPFMFLTDVDNRAAQALGIAMENGLPAGMEMFGYDKDTVYPTVIMTDASGKIIYSDFTNNYRIRPEPEEFIKVLNQHAVMV